MVATVEVAAVAACLLSLFGGASAQAAAQIGGAPPKEVQTQLCTIADVFGKLQGITSNHSTKYTIHPIHKSNHSTKFTIHPIHCSFL
jgi:hypothetical protein